MYRGGAPRSQLYKDTMAPCRAKYKKLKADQKKAGKPKAKLAEMRDLLLGWGVPPAEISKLSFNQLISLVNRNKGIEAFDRYARSHNMKMRAKTNPPVPRRRVPRA